MTDGFMTNVDRALLLAEWSATYGDGEDPSNDAGCPCCRAWHCMGAKHEAACPMDLALAERGFATQEDRDRARDFLTRKTVETATTLPPPKGRP